MLLGKGDSMKTPRVRYWSTFDATSAVTDLSLRSHKNRPATSHSLHRGGHVNKASSIIDEKPLPIIQRNKLADGATSQSAESPGRPLRRSVKIIQDCLRNPLELTRFQRNLNVMKTTLDSIQRATTAAENHDVVETLLDKLMEQTERAKVKFFPFAIHYFNHFLT